MGFTINPGEKVEMLAIFKTGGKQYSAKAGEILKVERLSGAKGDKISFNNVLAISDDKTNKIGEPLLKDAFVEAKIIDQIRDKKIIVFKKKRRHNYRRKMGHRQDLTLVKITEITSSNKKKIPVNEKKDVQKNSEKIGDNNGS